YLLLPSFSPLCLSPSDGVGSRSSHGHDHRRFFSSTDWDFSFLLLFSREISVFFCLLLLESESARSDDGCHESESGIWIVWLLSWLFPRFWIDYASGSSFSPSSENETWSEICSSPSPSPSLLHSSSLPCLHCSSPSPPSHHLPSSPPSPPPPP
ncbi:hypothetical protein PENTCL1PPCAC_25445, partial [Pristionchus entomophagus]